MHNNFSCLICIYHFARKNGGQVPQGLIFGILIRQYASYSAMLCSLHNSISKEQHESISAISFKPKQRICSLHNSISKKQYESISAIHPANTECMLVKHAPQRLIVGKPITQYASYSAMFCPLRSNIRKE